MPFEVQNFALISNLQQRSVTHTSYTVCSTGIVREKWPIVSRITSRLHTVSHSIATCDTTFKQFRKQIGENLESLLSIPSGSLVWFLQKRAVLKNLPRFLEEY